MLRSLDHAALVAMRTRGHSPGRERAVAAFAGLGNQGGVWLGIALAGTVADPCRRRAWLQAAAWVGGTLAANYAVKLAVRRPRPRLEGLPPLTGTISALSYPSAHAATSFAGAGVLSGLLPAPPLYALAAAISLTRPYLGIHYPSDVVAGAALGAALARFAR